MSTLSEEDGGVNRAPTIRFEVIGHSWSLFKEQWGVWVCATLIVVVAMALLNVSASIYLMGSAFMNRPHDPATMDIENGFNFPVTVTMNFLACWLGSGLFRMALKTVRGEAIAVSDVFKATDVMWRVFGCLCAIYILISIGTLLLVIPGILAAAVTVFAIPLIIDLKMRVEESIRTSARALWPHVMPLLGFCIVTLLILYAGAFAMWVGLLVTMPMFMISWALQYDGFFGPKEAPLTP